MIATRLAPAAQDTTAPPTLQNLLDPDILVPELIRTAFIVIGAIPFPHMTFYWGDGQMPQRAGNGS